MEMSSGKKIFGRNWDLITMQDALIDCINTSGGDQIKLITFTYRQVRLIVDV